VFYHEDAGVTLWTVGARTFVAAQLGSRTRRFGGG
jgi:hypothetical protein